MFFHYISYACIRICRFWEVKFTAVNIISECNNIYSFSILRDTKILTIQHFVIHCISNLLKSFFYNLKSSSSVMYSKTFYIFTKNHFRFMKFTYSNNILKQSSSAHSLIIVIKAHTLSCK